MFSLGTSRGAFAAALGATLLTVLMAAFVVPLGVMICGIPAVLEPVFKSAEIWHGHETDLEVWIKADGQIVIGRLLVPRHQVNEHLRAALARGPTRQLVLRPDIRSPFGSTRLVIRAAQSLGVRRIVIPSGMRSVSDYWAYKRRITV